MKPLERSDAQAGKWSFLIVVIALKSAIDQLNAIPPKKEPTVVVPRPEVVEIHSDAMDLNGFVFSRGAIFEDVDRLVSLEKYRCREQVKSGDRIDIDYSTCRQTTVSPQILREFQLPVDLNEASAAVLASLDGIGPVLAQRLLLARRERPFCRPEDMLQVTGIGQVKLARNRHRIRLAKCWR